MNALFVVRVACPALSIVCSFSFSFPFFDLVAASGDQSTFYRGLRVERGISGENSFHGAFPVIPDAFGI